MQAQRIASPDLECKDKFLIQSTIVPEKTIDEDITASMVWFIIALALDSGHLFSAIIV